ncbi:hypothetical protein LV84_02137 [Algoriphagus ratkowskyi]|uniref:Uncharacterized protein n=1 Tax=Algoriphagus ratkowskyi TaxID=57028 RepID=A0A2W7RD05_9BACT|nr:hypothetical protein [Algoriphagus ratkowskyi]PZX57006.1 hypothetical protein LV84_02137 [Algoriphagus ratkowskyi]TXD79910.1 hypothetical protein ESW18_01900 [Algoriphagus ratkowskyi]
MKNLFIITAIVMTLFVSCKEPKKEEATSNDQENVIEDNNAEMMRKQDSIQLHEKKVLDSLEQVKSHGHAH